MKILYVVHQFYPHYDSGTEHFVLNLASMLQKAGNKVKVITYRVDPAGPATGESGGIYFNETLYERIPVLEYWLSNPPVDLHFTLHIDKVISFAKQVLKHEKPDIVHLCHPMRSCGFLEAAESMDIPAIVTVTDLMFVCPNIVMITTNGKLCTDARGGLECNKVCFDTGDNNQKRMAYAEQLLTNAQAVVAPSAFLQGMLKAQFPKLDVKVLKHGLVMNGPSKQRSVLNDLDCVKFGYIGTIAEHKGLHILIQAFGKAKAENVRLKVYGDWDNFYGRQQKKLAGNDNRVEFMGHFNKEDIESAYGNIDVLIIPSICYESYSIVKYEAVIRNVPLMVSCLEALPEQIEDGVNGFIFSPGKPEELTNIILTVASNPAILDDIRIKMSSIFVSTIEQEAFGYLRIYRTCLLLS